jgi:hypothetical protein
MYLLFKIIFSGQMLLASDFGGFLEKIRDVPRSGPFKNCLVKIEVPSDPSVGGLGVYLEDQINSEAAYAFFPFQIEVGKDKIEIEKRRAYIRMVNDLESPHFYEDFVVEWNQEGKVDFLALRRFKSFGIFWNTA